MSDVEKTLAERGARYGKFEDHSAITQALEGLLLEHACLHAVSLTTYHREAIHMICHKLGRIVNGDPNYADSWHDIAGFATLVEKIIIEKNT